MYVRSKRKGFMKLYVCRAELFQQLRRASDEGVNRNNAGYYIHLLEVGRYSIPGYEGYLLREGQLVYGASRPPALPPGVRPLGR